MIIRLLAESFLLLILFLFILFSPVKPESYNEALLHPIILIPGDGGCQIEARLNKTTTNHWWCSKVGFMVMYLDAPTLVQGQILG